MRPIAEITDNCLEMMSPHELFSWEDWWGKVIKNGDVPRHKTYAYTKYIQKRNYVKIVINKELQSRKRPERLVCPGAGQGVYLVCETDVAELTVDIRVRKIVSTFEIGSKEMRSLSLCEKISGEDKRMLSRLGGLIELQQNTMIGTMAKMKSLPPATKKRLLKHLGLDT